MQSFVRGGRPLRFLLSLSSRSLSSSTRCLLPLLSRVEARSPVYYTSIRTKVWRSPLGDIPKVEKTIDSYMKEYLETNKNTTGSQEGFIDAVNPTKKITYSKMIKKIRSLEGFLNDRDFKKGDVAMVVLPNCVEFPIIFTSVIARGGVFSGLPPLATPYELETMFKSGNAKVIFTADVLLEKVMAAVEHNKSVETIVVVRTTDAPLPKGVHDFRTVADIKNKPELPKVEMKVDDVAVMPFSSGTTGIPKGVMLTHRNVMSGMLAIDRHHMKVTMKLAFPDASEEEHIALCRTPSVQYLPFYHIFGMVCMMLVVKHGTPTVTLAKFDPMVLLTNLQQYKPFMIHLVPPVAMFLAKHPLVDKFDLSSLRYCINGAAALPLEVGKALGKKYPNLTVTQGYGLSETSCAGTLTRMECKERHSVQGALVPGLEMKIVSLEDGRELGANETGEVCLRGNAIMLGYHDNQEETAKSLKNGWYHTGDIGFMNDQEELNIVDRMKELIKVKGLQVAPAELENVLLTDPRIGDVAVKGVPHPEQGEVPRAFVVKVDPSLTEADVKKVVEERLQKHKWLEGGVVFLSEIPKSPAGKILRRLLPSE